MAKFDTIIFDKVSGSVGDLTYYERLGENIVRSRNKSPRDPKTPSQLAHRARFAAPQVILNNIGWALGLTNPLKTDFRTFGTYFVSKTIEFMPVNPSDNWVENVKYLNQSNLGFPQTFNISKITGIPGQLTINFDFDSSILPNYDRRLQLLVWSTTGSMAVFNMQVTELDLINKYKTISFPIQYNSGLVCYEYCLPLGDCSNIKFYNL